MQVSVWERLEHNLTYTNALIIYSDPYPLVRHLEQLQDDYSMAYVSNTANLAEFRSQIVRQLFNNPLHDPSHSLLVQFNQFDDGNSVYLIVVKQIADMAVLEDLLSCVNNLAGVCKVIFECNALSAAEWLNLIEQKNSSARLIGELATQQQLETSKQNLSDKRKQPVVLLVVILLSLLITALIVGYLYYFVDKEPQSQRVDTLEPSPDISEQVKANVEVTDTQAVAKSKAIDPAEQLKSKPDMTAAEFFAQKAKEKIATATELEQNVLPEPEPEPEPEPLNNYDNDWFKQQDSASYVVQLTLISSDKLLAEYLADHQLTNKVKVYQYQNYFAVTLGLYTNLLQANQAIKSLPAALQNKGAFAKKVADIKKRINDN